MKSIIALAFLSILLKLCRGNHEGQLALDEVLPKGNPNVEKLPLLFLKRFYDGLSYDGFVGLMGRRMAGSKETPVAQKRDMHDFFVGLMGRRNMEFDEATTLNKDVPETKGPSTPIQCKLSHDPIGRTPEDSGSSVTSPSGQSSCVSPDRLVDPFNL